MAWFNATPLELSIVEQIETAFSDETIDDAYRAGLMIQLWYELERAHGSRVLSLVSPEGAIIERPVFLGSK